MGGESMSPKTFYLFQLYSILRYLPLLHYFWFWVYTILKVIKKNGYEQRLYSEPLCVWTRLTRPQLSVFSIKWIMSWVNITQKGPGSLSYQKKNGRTWLHPSFFWYDTDLSKKKRNIKEKKTAVYTKRRMGGATCFFFWYDNNSGPLCVMLTNNG